MSELLELAGGEEPERDAAAATDSAAVAMALDRKRGRGKADAAADRFLAAQEALIADQRRHLHEQLRTLGLDRWSKRLRLAFQALTMLVGVLVLGLVGWMAASAASADGLSIKPFSVPPALAARGVTGEAVASRVMDRLSQMTEESRSSERQKSVDADWGEHISIEIPETGVSLSQLDQWLRERLGRQRRVTGELNFTPDGKLELDARIGAHVLPPQQAPETDLNAMVVRVAEAIYAQEQATSYYLYLAQHGRWAEAYELGKRRAASLDPGERSSGLIDMGQAVSAMQGELAAKPLFEQSLSTGLNPSAAGVLADIEYGQGHWEQMSGYDREWLRRIPKWDRFSPEAARHFEYNARADIALDNGDYAAALPLAIAFAQRGALGDSGNVSRPILVVAETRAHLHDIRGARAEGAAFSVSGPHDTLIAESSAFVIAADAQDWSGVIAHVEASRRAAQAVLADKGASRVYWVNSFEAVALAHLGRFAEAHALIDAAPQDSVPANLARGALAQAEGRSGEADRWYGQAVRLAPTLPEPLYRWGRARLDRGEAREALTRFNAALKLGPRYPDAIEGRAEALLALGDAPAADKALADAARLAPRWGRLHLKWGEALARQGRAADARAQFALAAALDLTPAERTELAAVRHG